jgi:outer membrane protein assembly factor BamA
MRHYVMAVLAVALVAGGVSAAWAGEEVGGGAPSAGSGQAPVVAPAQPAGETPAAPATSASSGQVPAVAPAQPPLPALVASMEIVGNKQIATETIRAVIGSKVGGPYSESQVEADRNAIVKLGWFGRVSVDRENVESGVKLVFRVVENPVVTAVKFEGLREMKPEQLLAVMGRLSTSCTGRGASSWRLSSTRP